MAKKSAILWIMETQDHREANTGPTRGRRGPPKGTPKPEGSGRQKNTPNRWTRDVRAIASKHSAKAIKTLVALLGDADPKVRAIAAREILDRAHGKPMTPTEITGRDGGPIATEQVSDFELARMLTFVLQSASTKEEGKSPVPHEGVKKVTIDKASTIAKPVADTILDSEPEGARLSVTEWEHSRRMADIDNNRADQRRDPLDTGHPKVVTMRPRG